MSRGGAGVDVDLAERVRHAVASVDDPEFPGISIDAMGMVEAVVTSPGGEVTIELVPTYAGCPALELIAADVGAAVAAVAGVCSVDVRWRREVSWAPSRLSSGARIALARDFAVAVRAADGSLHCPVCESGALVTRSLVGPTRCRSIAWCPSCRNPVEVFRS